MKDNVVMQACAFLECSYFLLFTIALAHNQMRYSRKIVEYELFRWRRKEITPEWLGNFCLDVLAHRIKVDIECGTKNPHYGVQNAKKKSV